MIIFGAATKELKTESLFEKCPHCGTQNSMYMYVFQKYMHIFWIPFFPIEKTGLSQCTHCKQALKVNEMPPVLKNAFQNVKATAKTPIWTFALSFIIIGFIIFSVIIGKQKKAKNAQLILSPQAGDVFEVKTGNKEYTLYKVVEVNKDSVFINPNEYAIDKISGLEKLKNKSFSDEKLGFSKNEIKQMFDRRQILDIDRH